MPSFSVQFVPNRSTVPWLGQEGPSYAIGADPSFYRTIIYSGFDIGQALSNTQSFQEFAGAVPGATTAPVEGFPPGVTDPGIPAGLPPATAVTQAAELLYARDHMNRPLDMIRKDTPAWELTIWDSAAGTAQDLTGGTLTFTAKWAFDSPSAVFTLTSSPAAGLTVTSAAEGKVLMRIPSSATASLPNAYVRLVYDVQFVDSAGNVTTVMRGTIRVKPEVTL